MGRKLKKVGAANPFGSHVEETGRQARRRRSRVPPSRPPSSGVRELRRLSRVVEAAKLKIPISGEYPLRRADYAQRLAEDHVLGRIVLRIRQR